jgi:hypothetical protein
MKILVQTLGSSAINSVEFDTATESADVTFAKGGKYTYAIQFGKEYASADDIAQSITMADSAGAQFNRLVREGVLVATR